MLIYIFSFISISFYRTWLASLQQRKVQEKKDCFTLANTHYQQVHSSCSILASRLQGHTQISSSNTYFNAGHSALAQFVINPFTVSSGKMKAFL